MKTNFLFVSAENDGIPNCKAGGMGDVVRDIPRHIAAQGDLVHVITPAYGRLHKMGNLISKLNFVYRGMEQEAAIYEVPGKKHFEGLRHFVIDHQDIRSGDIAHIYFNDPEQPFFQDACTFSLFCMAVAEAVKQNCFGKLDIVHLHDWHTSLFLYLREYHPAYSGLKELRVVYSIHNLAIQGIRPLENNYSSIKAFYPELENDFERVKDPRYTDCINLMAVGIRFADAVHTVSPSYMEDVQLPSDPPTFIGGEGLEGDLKQAAQEHRLFGILNGCNYKNIRVAKRKQLYKHSLHAIFAWLQEHNKKYKADFLAHTGNKISNLMEQGPAFTCCSVARLTEQKFFFFMEDPGIMRAMLEKLKQVNGVYIVLGTGAPEYEELFREISYEYENFIFINGQSEDIIDSLYLESNLYIMPSLFEPCGISQMLAMRNGQPCFVHNTGGLKDTVKHLKTGFCFDGQNFEEKKNNLVEVFSNAVDLFFEEKEIWKHIVQTCKKQRFSWEDSVEKYYSQLYLRKPEPPKEVRIHNKRPVKSKIQKENVNL
ncbi:glycogen synthase [Robertkochia solimangrovi]|uniref:glycogen synthase n=1 Tax=Robertkochia solimangrovi TaxID=2213046 RepID=UPI00117FF5E0|nr:glycogen/starch synthase [Robertkochia solimangrovi]TRZ44204.1 glycogen synthase [Robertkochia solimangrovi]